MAAAPAAVDGATALALTSDELSRFGRTLVVAPHPDDEALGCAGLIARLGRCGQPVHAVLVSDGGQSHPASLRFDRRARSAVRQREWQQGLACVGVPADRLNSLGWPDGDLPLPGDPRFAAAVQDIRQLLDRVDPLSIVVPWRRDPHPDHRATHALFNAAMAPRHRHLRCFEYPVWLGERGAADDQPSTAETQRWQLDIADVLAAKRAAIACHRSQQGGVFTDDPGGFRLPDALLARALLPVETFFESRRP